MNNGEIVFPAEIVKEAVKPTQLETASGTEEVATTEPPKLNMIPKILTLIKGFTSFPKSAAQNTENKPPIRVHPFLRPFSRDSKDAPTNSAPTSAVNDVTFTSQGTYLFFEWLIFSTVRYYYFPILLQRWTGYPQLPALIS